ncbi:tRNA (adenine(22)-N(1))-methyltransferase [Bhargavaea cecembensis DSE10]|uniref:tRNA (Adenine(22)-N(1))-methyltransferase n=1 Tax=Bhargavaea cecembensis DSE10 TaxID=1235279 RepID=M7NF90_9BACL|nr:tRNA (adenine(22)-N(1))-methyltransferase TrmK [Bhargavaea cecembensis]EMR05917.1 tRNA (adenine(22)-N(1))-methyltransferase [Bhargavaea cecembensis DSE10]
MNVNKLSGRLQAVASHIGEDAVLADIGSDHAYLPAHLALRGRIRRGIAGEVAKGPYESAEATIRETGLQGKVEARLADGLEAILEEDGVDTVSIAGMGGPLIASILENGKPRLSGVRRLVLQPNIHAGAIRSWAMANGWCLTDEDILEEDGKIYEVLVLERGTAVYDDMQLRFGPFLSERQPPAFRKKWEREAASVRKILDRMQEASPSAERDTKEAELKRSLDQILEVLGNGEENHGQ